MKTTNKAYTLERANRYIDLKSREVNNRYKPLFHAAVPVGWANDPNGVIYYQGKYHLFYQFYPYAPAWGPMHWGHLESDDLVTYTSKPVALAPDLEDEHGCFSGGAIVDNDNNLLLMYTKHYNGTHKYEWQNIARSTDGVNFIKDDKPFLTDKDLPSHALKSDFRDPMPIYLDGVYYILIGSKTPDNIGQILVYKSNDLKTFAYHFTIGPDKRFGEMGECPSFMRTKMGDILIISGINIPRVGNEFKKVNSSVALIGNFDFVNKNYHIAHIHEIDSGHDFYAPQTLINPSGEVIMHAWMNMWNKNYFTALNGDGWSGSFVLPRVLSLKGKRLYQKPILAIDKYFNAPIKVTNNMLIDQVSRLKLQTLAANWTITFSGEQKDDSFMIGVEEGSFFFDSQKSKNFPQQKIFANARSNEFTLEIFLDRSSIEIFINDGYETMTNLIYFATDSYQLHIENSEALLNAEVMTFKGGQ